MWWRPGTTSLRYYYLEEGGVASLSHGDQSELCSQVVGVGSKLRFCDSGLGLQQSDICLFIDADGAGLWE